MSGPAGPVVPPAVREDNSTTPDFVILPSQIMVGHTVWGMNWTTGCVTCTAVQVFCDVYHGMYEVMS